MPQNREVLCGGIKPVQNVDDPSHHEFIQAALAETGTHVGKEYTIVRASVQVVAGTMHRLHITFNDDPAKQEYEITAWSRPWLKEQTPSEALKLTFSKKD